MPLRKELIQACHKVYANSFVAAYDGNLSARIDDKKLLITPSGKCKGELEEKDLLEIDYEGKVLSGDGLVSAEVKMHLLAYQNREDVNAVVHSHPIHASAFCVVDKELSQPIFPESILSLGKIPLCKYSTISTEEVEESILPYIGYVWVLLLQNHGVLAFGKSIKDAYFKVEKLEHFAKIMTVAEILGGANKLSVDQLKKLYMISEEIYGVKVDDKMKFL
ncbi:MAG: class II aldolase/adducin family protein [Ignavibacteriales bacterium]|nr:class II aldolase/adducin family protein [Ignavibacteriales bacterium]